MGRKDGGFKINEKKLGIKVCQIGELAEKRYNFGCAELEMNSSEAAFIQEESQV